jgi:uncharacterized protein (DUF1778 family)
MAKQRDLSAEHRKPHQIRYSDAEWAEITLAANLDGVTRAYVVRPASLEKAREIMKRHRARD